MAGNKKSEKHNARKGSRQLSPREELEIKQRLKRKEKKSTIIKRAITAFILTIVVLVALVGVYLFSFISSLNNNDIISAVKPSSNETVNILLLGMDIGDAENTSNSSARRTDTMMMINYNPRTDNINVVSIPRDTLIEVENATDGKGNKIPYWKINAAYVLGGEEEVEMYIDRDMYYDDDAQDLHIHFNAGETVLLDGQKAEEYFRWRKNNDGTGLAEGDLGRIKNQQAFIAKVIEKCTSPEIITQIPSILKAVKENIVTNMSGSDMIYYGLKMVKNEGISMNTLQGDNERIYGQDFLVMNPSYNQSLLESLKITSEANKSANRSGYSIMVLNATRVNGLAGNLRIELENLGYTNVSVGNYDKSKESKILSNDKELKKLLSEDTGINDLSKNKEEEYENYDAVIIIGEDYLTFN